MWAFAFDVKVDNLHDRNAHWYRGEGQRFSEAIPSSLTGASIPYMHTILAQQPGGGRPSTREWTQKVANNSWEWEGNCLGVGEAPEMHLCIGRAVLAGAARGLGEVRCVARVF